MAATSALGLNREQNVAASEGANVRVIGAHNLTQWNTTSVEVAERNGLGDTHLGLGDGVERMCEWYEVKKC